ncbi:MAG TPA: hypothetical protein VFR29_06085 [Steroidobacteraceae bacterium]|nr:hypothetical protein [Steroidobacteraceae bacterium]
MKTALASLAVSRVVVVAIIAALLQLGPAMAGAHAGDGCNDETCTSSQCDLAAGDSCAGLCAHVVSAPAAVKAVAASVVRRAVPFETPRHHQRLKDQPFRPPILA